MSGADRTGRWPGFAAPGAALVATLVLIWLTGMTGGAEVSASPVSALLMMVLLPAPLVVAVLWGAALLTGRPFAAVPVAAGAALAAGWLLVTGTAALTVAGHVAGGLMAGWALGRRWRLDLALGAVALALVPILIWSAMVLPPREQFAALSDELIAATEQNLPRNADPEQRAAALQTERENLERVVAQLLRVYPWLMAVGVLGQAGIILAGVRFGLGVAGIRPVGWRVPPFAHWRVPFYVVWVLIAGLGLMLTRRSPYGEIGLNLALLGATVLSVQGIAVQFFVTGRMLSVPGRVIYWTVMGLFFGPLVLASGVVLGVADQWWDIRRLDRQDGAADGAAADEDDTEDDGGDNDDDAGPDERHRD